MSTLMRYGPLRFLAGVAVIAGIMVMYRLLAPVNPTTAGLTLLLAVLIFAATSGLGVAIFLSVLATLCFNYFFLPPLHTFTISSPQDWVALVTFLVTAVVGSELSERARRQARDADRRRAEAERLYAELKQARAEREAEQLRAALLDSVAHEFRTPLTAIKASVTSLLAGAAPAEADRSDLLHVIDEEADRLNQLMGQALDMARLDAGEVRLELTPHPMSEAVEAALERARRVLDERPVEVAVPAGLEARMDLERVVEVLAHLLDNATRYSPPQSPIRILSEMEGGSLVTSVADRGPGVSEAEQELVFDKFYRGKEQRGKVRGTGLGLSIVRAIVHAHGGRMGVRSRAGGGAVFWFTLPTERDGA